MAESVEIVSLPMERIFEPGEHRFPRVGVMSAHAKNTDVKGDEGVAQGGEPKPLLTSD